MFSAARTLLLSSALALAPALAPSGSNVGTAHAGKVAAAPKDEAGRKTWIEDRRSNTSAAYGLSGHTLASATTQGGSKVREQTVQATKSGGTAHSVRYKHTLQLAGGRSSRSLEVEDQTAGKTIRFAYDDDAGTGTITLGSASVAVGFNADGTISVDGAAHATTTAAAQAIADGGKLSAMTEEMAAVIVEVVGAISKAGGAKGNEPLDPPSVTTIETTCAVSSTCR